MLRFILKYIDEKKFDQLVQNYNQLRNKQILYIIHKHVHMHLQ
jgi:hypothetical protein